jgi:hypothetical protein
LFYSFNSESFFLNFKLWFCDEQPTPDDPVHDASQLSALIASITDASMALTRAGVAGASTVIGSFLFFHFF